jgi:hypothetical protein
MEYGNLTVEQIENIVIDAGILYINYGEADERELAPVSGANTFVVEREFKDIEHNGHRGKTKGLRRIITEDCTLTVNIKDLSQDNIKLALAGANVASETGAITNGDGLIPDSDYLKNVTLVGKTLGGIWKVISVYNALSDNGLNIEMADKEESSIELAFAGHRNPQNVNEPIYSISEVDDENTLYNVIFTIESDNSVIQDATVNFNGRVRTTDINGIAAFSNIKTDNNQPFTVYKGGYLTYDGSVDVVDSDVNLTVDITLA